MSIFRNFLVHIFPHSSWIRRDIPYLSVFTPNTERNGPENFRIQTLLIQCYLPKKFEFYLKSSPLFNIGTFKKFQICTIRLNNRPNKSIEKWIIFFVDEKHFVTAWLQIRLLISMRLTTERDDMMWLYGWSIPYRWTLY